MLLVGNGLLVTRDNANPLIENGCVAIKDDCVLEVGTTAELKNKYPEAKFIDAEKKVIMPGLINTHHHYYSTFARGMDNKEAPSVNFQEILERLWWKLDKLLTIDDLYYCAMLPIIDSIKNGVTTIFDHHASPYAIEGSLFKLAEASRDAGVRSCLCYEVSDRDGEARADEGIKENIDFIKYTEKENGDMLKGMFGLHASFTVSDKTLEKCVQEISNTDSGFHVHVAEGPGDLADSKAKYGMGVVERLHSRKVLGEKAIAVHCIHISDKEIDILAESKTNVVHNPESNMGNAVGVSPVLKMMEKGVNLGLGTDGYTSDMIESYKVGNILHKHANQDPSVAWGEIPTMLFENNPKIVNEYFHKPIGKLVPGAYADVIIVDYDPWTPMNANNINSHILFGMMGREVDTTIINGKVIMENRKLLNLDSAEIHAKARELAKKLWAKI